VNVSAQARPGASFGITVIRLKPSLREEYVRLLKRAAASGLTELESVQSADREILERYGPEAWRREWVGESRSGLRARIVNWWLTTLSNLRARWRD
jgi:hypothetical protein